MRKVVRRVLIIEGAEEWVDGTLKRSLVDVDRPYDMTSYDPQTGQVIGEVKQIREVSRDVLQTTEGCGHILPTKEQVVQWLYAKGFNSLATAIHEGENEVSDDSPDCL